MAEVKWIKITTNMFEDEKIKLIDAMPERDTIHYIWIRLLVQAGKTNANGFIFLTENIPYSEEMLSTIFNRPLSSIRLALNTFVNFGMIKIESSFLEVTNWNKYQNIEGLEKIREQNRIRKQRQRAKNLLSSKDESGHEMSRDSHAIEQEQQQDIEQDIETEYRTTTVVESENIEKIRKELIGFDLTYEQARDIYYISNGNVEHIIDVYNYSKTQNIKNKIGWLRVMVKPSSFNMPKKISSKGNFNNFKQRTYDFKKLEMQLLGWDDQKC